MPAPIPPQATDEFRKLLDFVAQSAVDNLSPERFQREIQMQASMLAPQMFNAIIDPRARQAAIGHFARTFWNDTPQPHHGWRARPLPKPERNSPCPCGSGRKYKQCCQPYEAPLDLPPRLNMLRIVLERWPGSDLHIVPLARLDPAALADATHAWNEAGDGQRSIALLEQLFADATGVDARHAECFDMLCDAYMDEGLREMRGPLIERFAVHPSPMLASTALQRATVIACDEGDYKRAWEHFGKAMRLTPDDPFLAHLEVLVLRSEGRIDEARARATVWAKRLRRLGRPEYDKAIESLERMAEDPDMEFHNPHAWDGIEDEAWAGLLEELPELELLYDVEPIPGAADDHGPGRTAIRMQPRPALARVERDWRDRFFVQKPTLVGLYGDASKACADFDDICAFLREQPMAWQSFEILDDLVLIAREWFEEGGESDDNEEDDTGDEEEFDDGRYYDEEAVLLELTLRGVLLLRMCADTVAGGSAMLAWSVPANRPPLRLVAQRIEAVTDPMTDAADVEVECATLQDWMLKLNPNDNHGYRNPVMQNMLIAGDWKRAIELAAGYPEDVGDMPFDRALALYRAGRKNEARASWLRGAGATPVIAETLLAEDPEMPGPEDDDGEDKVLGGRWHALRYRLYMHEAWQAGGALAWARTLPRTARPEPEFIPDRLSAMPKQLLADGASVPDFAAGLDETSLLRSLASHDFNAVPLHGMLSATTLSPRLIMPGEWVDMALGYHGDKPVADIAALNESLVPMMGLYNFLNSALRIKQGKDYTPSPDLPTADPAQATAWARGFMRIVEQGRGAWRDKTASAAGKAALTAIERAAAGMVSDDRLAGEAAALGLDPAAPRPATWHDVLAAATRVLAGKRHSALP